MPDRVGSSLREAEGRLVVLCMSAEAGLLARVQAALGEGVTVRRVGSVQGAIQVVADNASDVAVLDASALAMDSMDSSSRLAAQLAAKTEELARVRSMLAAREAQHVALLSSTNDFVWEVDPQFRYVFVSPQCESMTGYRPEELIGRTPFEFMADYEMDAVRRDLQDRIDRGMSLERVETPRLHRDGRRVVLETYGVRLESTAGEYLGYRGVTRDVTERKRLAVELALREEELTKVEEIGRVGSFTVRFKTQEVTWTRGVERILGLEPGPCDVERALSVIHPDDRVRLRADVAQAVAAQLTWLNTELRAILPGGEVRYLDVRGEFMRDPAGVALALQGTMADVTELRAVGEEREELLGRTAELVQELHCLYGIAELTRECSILGGELCQRTVDGIAASWLAPDVSWVRILMDRRVFTAGDEPDGPPEYESPVVAAGEPRGHVQLAHGLSWQGRTDELRREQRRDLVAGIAHLLAQALETEEAQQALRASESRHRALVENSPDSILDIDLRTGTCTFASGRATEQFGYAAEEFHGMALEVLFGPGAEDVPMRLLDAARAGGGVLADVSCQTRDGATFYAEVNVAPAGPSTGGFGAIAILRDVSVRRRIAEELQHAKEEAERATRIKSDFLSSMSHEIRTPFNAILGFTQLLCRDPSVHPKHKQQLTVIHRSGEQVLALIDDILEMSKLEAGHSPLVPEVFELRAVVEEAERLFQVRAQDKGLVLASSMDPRVPRWLVGDPRKVRQVLSNLLGNAVKFTEQGGITVRVQSWDASPDSVEVMIQVQDTGPGVEESLLQRLFEPFEQGAAGVRRGGTGLGLAISRNMARLHGGDLTVDTTHRVGSVFDFRFRAGRVEASAAGAVDSCARGAALRPSARAPVTVLPPAGGALSDEELAAMRSATETGDRAALLARIRGVRAHAPAAAELLERLALDYDYDSLLRVLQTNGPRNDG